MASSDFKKNQELLKLAAIALGPMLDRIAFVGGATTILYLTDRIRDVRATLDVDVILEVTRTEFHEAEEDLRRLGFQPDPRVICRHRKGDLIIDFMPTDGRILGFSSRWYSDALHNARPEKVAGVEIKVLSFPYFVATKLEAFNGRGQEDYYGSKDIEDLVTVFAGRAAFLRELRALGGELGEFIRSEFARHLEDAEFMAAVEGHMPRDSRTSPRQIIADLRDLASGI